MTPRRALLLLLLLGTVSWEITRAGTVSSKQDERELILLEVERPSRSLSKRQAQSGSNSQVPPPEYLEFLSSLQSDPKTAANIHQVVVQRNSPQEPTITQQYYTQQPQQSSAYNLHQARLTASLTGGNPNKVQSYQAQDSAENDAALQRQAALNAQQAAAVFRQSYQQRQPSTSVRIEAGKVRELQPTYATSFRSTSNEPESYHQQAFETPQEVYKQAPQQANTAAIQALYQYQDPQNQPHSQAALQSFQQQASLAEQAAIAFQQALQQQSKSGAQAQRPRLSVPQYVLEQQHSYVVPNTKSRRPESPVPTEEYNLAALQQAYQQIESAQQKAVEQIQRQPARPVLPTQPTVTYAEEESTGIHLGDGDGFEFAKQSGEVHSSQRVRQPQRQLIRQRVQPQHVQPQHVQQQHIAQQQAEHQQQVEHQQTVALIQQRQRQPTTYKQAEIEASVYQPQPQAVLPTPQPEIPKRQRTQAPPQAIATAVQIPRARPQTYTPAPQTYTPTPQTYTPAPQTYTPAPQAYSPEPQTYTPVAARQPVGKIGNIDLNLLRSLYQAAETLAKQQKDEVSPISEDDLLKALLAQGRREQQAAEIIQTAAKANPAPPPEDKDVVRIPTPKNQRPITQEELQALIDAGYDVRPVGEPKAFEQQEPVDPIKQQYLRQAQFLEQQLALKSRRSNQRTPARRARDENSESPATEEKN